MERISEPEVVGAMPALTTSNVMGLWEQQRSEWRKPIFYNSKNLDKGLRLMDMDDLATRETVKVQKKLVLVSGSGQRLTR